MSTEDRLRANITELLELQHRWLKEQAATVAALRERTGRLERICRLHGTRDDELCVECEDTWPCPTYDLANWSEE